MNITNAIKKQKAIELMNKLDIYKPYIPFYKFLCRQSFHNYRSFRNLIIHEIKLFCKSLDILFAPFLVFYMALFAPF